MKSIATAAVGAVLLGGLSIAAAQNAPTSNAPVSPNNINKGTEPGTQCGS